MLHAAGSAHAANACMLFTAACPAWLYVTIIQGRPQTSRHPRRLWQAARQPGRNLRQEMTRATR
eukprot:11460225-Alexandrium_andersonii.AAC.1